MNKPTILAKKKKKEYSPQGHKTISKYTEYSAEYSVSQT